MSSLPLARTMSNTVITTEFSTFRLGNLDRLYMHEFINIFIWMSIYIYMCQLI